MKLRPFSTIDATKKEEILNAAQKVFAKEGFKEATIRQICKAARANVCLVSYYFDGKDGLYRAIFERAGENQSPEIKNLLGIELDIATKEEFRVRLRIFLEKVYSEMIQKPDFFELMHREIADGMPRAEDVIRKYFERTKTMLVDFFKYGQKKKYIKKEFDPDLTCQALMNMLMGFVHQQNIQRNDIFFKGISNKDIPEQVIKTVSSIFFDGVTQ